MRVTKFVHSCLLVETPERTALFDPGGFSQAALDLGRLERLDDIFITHEHGDHFSPELVQRLVGKFPKVRITTTPPVVKQLAAAGIPASPRPADGSALFNSPHEDVSPLFSQPPEQIGIHYLGLLSHPGDSHSFTETKPVLALPVTAPWGSAIRAYQLAFQLKPRHVLPIHDWHWRDEARAASYDQFERILGVQGITFHKLETGRPVDIPT